jgi:hypothetical protein
MKTWNELNKEFTEERLKENPDVDKLERLNIEMLNTFKEVNSFDRVDLYSIYAKCILIISIISLVALYIYL